MSGVANAIPLFTLPKTNWWAPSEKLGCGGRPDHPRRRWRCLRPIPGRAIMRALEGAVHRRAAAAAIMKFGPVADGKTAFADIATRGYEGNFIKRPMLVGNTHHEMGLVAGMLEGTLKGSIQKGGAAGLLATMGQAGINYWSRRARSSVSSSQVYGHDLLLVHRATRQRLSSEAQRSRVEDIDTWPSGPTPAGWRAWYVIKLPDLSTYPDIT